MAKPRSMPYEGVHHIILKGIDACEVFHNSDDKDYFLTLMKRYSEKLSIPVSSYALMDNHIHLSVKIEGEYPLGEFVKRLCISYVQHYFNKKYDRQGALFQAKFFSRPIDGADDFITVVKYILLNPLKGGLCNGVEYNYSSYQKTVSSYGNGSLIKENGSCDFTDIIARIQKKSEFIRFINDNNVISMYEEPFRMRDYEIRQTIEQLTEDRNGSYARLKSLQPGVLREMLRDFIKKNVSIARLSRISGLSRYFIRATIA